MIVDGKGNLFEDRRKNKQDRRNKECIKDNKNSERRKEDRRKAPEQVKKHGYTK